MFVSPDARAKLRAERRERFFTDLVEPMLAQAALLGIGVAEIVQHLEEKR
jgi:hypothetical protein